MSAQQAIDLTNAAETGARAIEITTPTAPLTGQMVAGIYEGDTPTNGIIRVDQESSVRVYWTLKGPLADCICGSWCVKVHLESIGSGPEFELSEVPRVELDPCGDGNYHAEIRLTPEKVTPAHCSSVYKLVATVTYLTPCNKPGPMAGFYEFPGLVQFYKSDK